MTRIPIVPYAQWEREICARCVEPGHCCKRFNLSGSENHPATFWDDEAPAVREGLPFVPLERWGQWTVEYGPDTGRTYSSWMWRCTALGEDGRCTIYDDRPDLCRRYEPLEDGLCVMAKSGPAQAQGLL